MLSIYPLSEINSLSGNALQMYFFFITPKQKKEKNAPNVKLFNIWINELEKNKTCKILNLCMLKKNEWQNKNNMLYLKIWNSKIPFFCHVQKKRRA